MKTKNRFFEIVDNFATTAHVPSIPIFESQLDFVPKVTIAIPTYRRPKMLKDAIDSAINQIGFEDYDIIVVDNNPGRDDETETMMAEYKGTRVSYYKNAENIQMVGNWNRLYTLAKGEYVVMLHDDDMLFPNYATSLFPIIKDSEYDAYYTTKVIYDARKGQAPPMQTQGKLICKNIKTETFIKGHVTGAPTGMCAKKEKVIEMGGFSPRYFPSFDYEFIVKFSYYFRVCEVIGFPLTIYRLEENVSMNTRMLLNFVEKDIAIKQGIIANKSFFVRRIWDSHIRVQSYKYLKNMNYLVDKSIPIKMALEGLGIKYGKIDYAIYKGINAVSYVLQRRPYSLRKIYSYLKRKFCKTRT